MDYNNIPIARLKEECETSGTEFVIEDGKVSFPDNKTEGGKNA